MSDGAMSNRVYSWLHLCLKLTVSLVKLTKYGKTAFSLQYIFKCESILKKSSKNNSTQAGNAPVNLLESAYVTVFL